MSASAIALTAVIGIGLAPSPTARSPIATPTARSPIATAHHANQLRTLGYTVIPDAGISHLVDAARDSCSLEFSESLSQIASLGMDPQEDKYAFAEIATRHKLRWCLRPADDNSDWNTLIDAAVAAATPVIEECTRLPPHPDDSAGLFHLPLPAAPKVVDRGAIVSKPGAKAQIFHADAGETHLQMAKRLPQHRLYNVFIPLVDIEADGDGTQLWPRSHHHRTRSQRYYDALGRTAGSGRLEDDAVALAEMEAPACPAGGLLVFDFRVLHRGLPNDASRNRDRLLAHAIVSTGQAWDVLNHEAESLKEALEGGEEAEAIVQRQREAWGRVRASSKR